MLQREKELPHVLAGDNRHADPTMRLEFARLCKFKRQFTLSARFCAEALAAEPKWGNDPRSGIRYYAACAAALAASGQGNDAPAEASARSKLRQQALSWLRADLAACTKLVDEGKIADRKTVAELMRQWQREPEFSSVQHPWSLLRLPAEERRRWQKLWADVDDLLKKASKTGM